MNTVTPYFQYLTPKTAAKREAAKYVGGEARELTESDDSWIHLSFQSLPWSSPELPALYVLHAIVSLPTTGTIVNCRSNAHFLQKHQFLNSANAVIESFSDSGNWGITVSGSNAKSGEMADALTKEIQDLAKVTDEKFARAKNLLKTQMLTIMSNTEYRLEKMARKQMYMGVVKDIEASLAMIDGVTADQVRGVASKVTKTRPTLVVLGGEIHKVPSVDGFAARFKYQGPPHLFSINANLK